MAAHTPIRSVLRRLVTRPIRCPRLLRAALFTALATLALAGCQTAGPRSGAANSEAVDFASIDALLSAAQTAGLEQGTLLRLRAIELLITAGDYPQAHAQLTQLPDPQTLPRAFVDQITLSRAHYALATGAMRQTLDLLQSLDLSAAASLTPEQRSDALITKADALIGLGRPQAGASDLLAGIDSPLPAPAAQRLADATWSVLNQLTVRQIEDLVNQSSSYTARGWLELSRSIRREDFSLRGQLDAVARWQRVWAQHPASAHLPKALAALASEWDQRPRHIALALPLREPAGRALQEGFVAAYYQSLAISREVPRISVIDSSETKEALDLVEAAIALGADLLVGPLDKGLVNQLAQLPQLPIPTLALNYTDIEESFALNQFGLAPEDEIERLVSAASSRGFTRAAIVTPAGDNYSRLSNEFSSRWEARGGAVVAQRNFITEEDYSDVVKGLLAVDASEDRARRLRATLPRNNIEFTPQRRSDIDFIFLAANPRQGRQLVPTLAFYYAQDLPLFALPSIYDGDPKAIARDLDGLLFADGPWMVEENALRGEADTQLSVTLGSNQRLRGMGVDSFYLAMQLKQLKQDASRTLRGVTGMLTLESSGRVSRELMLVRFENGIPKPVESAP